MVMATYRYVPKIPDLIDAAEYDDHPEGNLVRLQIRVTDDGVEVISDALRPELAEQVLQALGAKEIDQMLCG
jgi:hypothetical protein